MFSHRGLFLAVMTISLASISLANVLVQPGYKHQYDSNRRYLQDQSAPQYWTQSPIEQYRAEQLPDQESTQYRPGVQTVYPYESNQADARSHVLSYPHRPPYHHYLPRSHHVHFARIGGHGYVRPSVYGYVGHPQSLMVHNRRKRSDPASTESSKSEVVAHDNDVAAKSPSTDAKHPTTIDSLLPEHEPTDTTAVTFSLASIALADVLVLSGYEHQYDSNPRYLQHQSVSQHWIRSPIEQYRAEQLPDQESTRYFPGVPELTSRSEASTTEKNEDPKETKRKRMEELRRRKQFIYHLGGGRRSPQPLMVHNRKKRSDPASTKSSKSEVVAHDNVVATKLPLTDAKHSTAIDSLLPEHEFTDTTDKHVENRQIENNYMITHPHSFGFYTKDTHPVNISDIYNGIMQLIFELYAYLKPLFSSSTAQKKITNMHNAPVYNAPVLYDAPVYNNPVYNASSVYNAPLCYRLICIFLSF
ncbi:uncharacterized protein LOC112453707 [Temnothorax curvispinosus]|uniref:Uncharacterized protein LOC112453707 n=1 Tax=Temnothorax curvispinosus TaxID=300111 RepID=A0A6J1PMM6_9HYME|nr:uncharacterized protein LOC112453707 [Temnothorax curvispinosus]